MSKRVTHGQFHAEPFDDGTRLKLDLFRRYVRSWVPVFLTKTERYSQRAKVHVYDFFSGPGADSQENPGSPLIIVQELKTFCVEKKHVRVAEPDVTLHFSDADPQHTTELKSNIRSHLCDQGCCKLDIRPMAFAAAFSEALPILRDKNTACLVIMDQFGLKDITPDAIRELAACPMTDILFFVSSSFVHRFPDHALIRSRFNLSEADLHAADFGTVHRRVCEYFRQALPSPEKYHLAPFSIKKGANIYGVIFGSAKYLGLYKFLDVCWKLDGTTGEANYPIDRDTIWGGQQALFPEDNVTRKADAFRRELLDFIASATVREGPLKGATNRKVLEFTLEHGFLPKHAAAELKRLRDEGIVEAFKPGTLTKTDRGAFYVSWDAYDCNPPAIRSTIRLLGEPR